MGFFNDIFSKFGNKKAQNDAKKIVNEMRVVKNISTLGFEIYDLNDNLKKSYDWKKIKSIKFSSDFKELHITDFNGNQANIPEKTTNWYALIQKIPETFAEFDHAYVKQFMEDVIFCEVCGMKAVKNGICLHCYSDVWNSELEEDYENKEAYIKAEQLDLYSTINPVAPINLNMYDKSGFEKNPDFKVSVSKEEIFIYSEENFFAKRT